MYINIDVYDNVSVDISIDKALDKELSSKLTEDKDKKAWKEIYEKLKHRTLFDVNTYIRTVEVDSKDVIRALREDDIESFTEEVYVKILPNKTEINDAIYKLDRALYFNDTLSKDDLMALRNFLEKWKNNEND